MTRMRRSLYSLAATYLGTIIVMISGLMATPLLLVYLGEERVGITRTGTEWLNYMMLIASGIDGALSAHFAKSCSQQDRAATLSILRAGLRAFFFVAVMSCIWIIILNIFADRLFGLDPANPALSWELHYALLLATAGQFCVLGGTFRPLIDAEQRGYVAQLANTVGTVVSLAMSVLLAWLGCGLQGQMVALMLSPLVGGGILAADVLRRYPEALTWQGPRAPGIHAINPAMLLVHFCSRVSTASDCIIVSLVLGQSPVAMFSLSQRLMILTHGVVGSIGSATWAALTDLYHRGERETFTRRLLQLTRLTALLSSASLIPAAVWNGPFVRAWTGKADLYAGDLFSLLTAFNLILFGIATLWTWQFTTTGRVRMLVPVYALGMTTFLLTSFVALKGFGVIGPALGGLANMLGVTLWCYARLYQREFQTPFRSLLAAAFGPIFLAIPYAAGLWYLGQQFSVDELARSRLVRMGIVAALMGVSAAGFLTLAFSMVIPRADRQEFLKRFRRSPA